jgi:hypothetical protein
VGDREGKRGRKEGQESGGSSCKQQKRKGKRTRRKKKGKGKGKKSTVELNTVRGKEEKGKKSGGMCGNCKLCEQAEKGSGIKWNKKQQIRYTG